MFSFVACLQGMGESNAAVNSRPRVSRETMLAAAAAYQGSSALHLVCSVLSEGLN